MDKTLENRKVDFHPPSAHKFYRPLEVRRKEGALCACLWSTEKNIVVGSMEMPPNWWPRAAYFFWTHSPTTTTKSEAAARAAQSSGKDLLITAQNGCLKETINNVSSLKGYHWVGTTITDNAINRYAQTMMNKDDMSGECVSVGLYNLLSNAPRQ